MKFENVCKIASFLSRSQCANHRIFFSTSGVKTCCKNIGCFDNSKGLMKNFPEPNCPEDIGMKLYLFTRQNPDYEDRLELTHEYVPYVSQFYKLESDT